MTSALFTHVASNTYIVFFQGTYAIHNNIYD